MYHIEELARVRRDEAVREGLESQRVARMLREARRERREQQAPAVKTQIRSRPLVWRLSCYIQQILAWR